MIGILSAGVWSHVKGADAVPDGAIEYAVTARQFEWDMTHGGADGRLGTGDDVVVRNQLHVPVNQPVSIRLTAEDVIHSFFVPAFRVKQDATPGMEVMVWFEATEPGEYEIACAELCGLGHYRMGAMVTVHTQADYDAWLASQAE